MDLSPGSISEPRRLRAGEITRVVEVVCVAEAIATIVAIVWPSHPGPPMRLPRWGGLQWNTPAQGHPAGSDRAARDPPDRDSAVLLKDESSPARAPPAPTNAHAHAPSALKTSGPAVTSLRSPQDREPRAASPHRSPPPAMAGTRSPRSFAVSHESAACLALQT